jgi:hypothetical protein
VPNKGSDGDEDKKAPSSVSSNIENLGHARCDVCQNGKRKITALKELVVTADKKKHNGRRELCRLPFHRGSVVVVD